MKTNQSMGQLDNRLLWKIRMNMAHQLSVDLPNKNGSFSIVMLVSVRQKDHFCPILWQSTMAIEYHLSIDDDLISTIQMAAIMSFW